ncbi:hypothetical protein ACSLBF_11305 [Pseudoalteromonas sp. T1lg65]|uniref:hypothetical protein n=1 Tax=Pseudoalteromonas sp. T1lg65 TaxID=2077101 RepID=UPI003F7939CA
MNNTLKRLHIALVVMLFAWVDVTSAHGLQMTTAQIVQRQDNYLFITINTPLSKLYQNINYADKPASIIHLANSSKQQIKVFREALLKLFKEELTLSVAGKSLRSMRVSTLSAKELQKLLQAEMAAQVLNSAQGQSNHHHSDRKNYLRIEVDGFLPEVNAPRVLNGQFPRALGQILVSYSKPQMQTLSPSEHGSIYTQALLK